jgi:O-antigen/teichoic acid export membrane protein
MIPLLFNYLGEERFGLWMSVSVISIYIMLFDFGVGSAMINKLTCLYSHGKKKDADTLIASILVCLVVISGLIMMAAILILPRIDLVAVLKLTSMEARREVLPVVLLATCIFAAQLPLSLIVKVPYTMQRGALSEAYALAGNLICFIGIMIGISSGWGLLPLVFFLTGQMAFVPIAIAAHLLISGQVTLKRCGRDKILSHYREVRHEGFNFLTMQAGGLIISALPFTLIALYRGATDVAVYGLMVQILQCVQTPLVVTLQPLWTKMAQLSSLGQNNVIGYMLKKYVMAAAAYSVVSTLFFLFLLNPALSLVMKKTMEIPFDLVALFAIWSACGLVAGGGIGVTLMATGLSSELSRVNLLQLFVFILCAVLLIPKYGVSGAVMSSLSTYVIGIPTFVWLIRNRIFSASAKLSETV